MICGTKSAVDYSDVTASCKAAINLVHSVLSTLISVCVFWQQLMPTVTAVVFNEHCTDF